MEQQRMNWRVKAAADLQSAAVTLADGTEAGLEAGVAQTWRTLERALKERLQEQGQLDRWDIPLRQLLESDAEALSLDTETLRFLTVFRIIRNKTTHDGVMPPRQLASQFLDLTKKCLMLWGVDFPTLIIPSQEMRPGMSSRPAPRLVTWMDTKAKAATEPTWHDAEDKALLEVHTMRPKDPVARPELWSVFDEARKRCFIERQKARVDLLSKCIEADYDAFLELLTVGLVDDLIGHREFDRLCSVAESPAERSAELQASLQQARSILSEVESY